MKSHRLGAKTCCRPGCEELSLRSGYCRRHALDYQNVWRKQDRKDNHYKYRWADHKKWAIKRKGVSFALERDWYVNWFKTTKECEYCGVTGQKLQVDRKDPSKGYVMGNVALVCRKCNLTKSNTFTPEEWVDIVKRYNLRERFWGCSKS